MQVACKPRSTTLTHVAKKAPPRNSMAGSARGGALAAFLLSSMLSAQVVSTLSPQAATWPGTTPVSEGQAQNQLFASSRPVSDPDLGANQPRYLVTSGDVLDVSVFGAPDLSQRAAVNGSGNIYMPLVSYIHVAGMHVEDAQAAVERAYLLANVLKSPHVSIAITSYSSGVVLLGEVAKQGIYRIAGSGKLFDMLSEAGGVTAAAGQVVTIKHRDDPEAQTVLLTSNPDRMLAADVPIRQGDKIIVSKAGVIYVVGEVYNPSGFAMDDKGQYTVLKAIAMAHGTTKYAQPAKARIVRRTPDGNEEIPVPLDKILLSKAPDIPLQANDIVFVPTNKTKQALGRTADVAIGLASGLTIVAAGRL